MTDIIYICGNEYDINTTILELEYSDLTDSIDFWNNIILLQELTELKISFSTLDKLSPSIGQLTKLTHLYLDNTNIMEIPIDVWDNIKQLKELSLNNTSIIIPKEIELLTNIVYLDISNNNITELPNEIFTLNNIQHLYFSGNIITNIPTKIGLLTNLKSLDFSNNLITSLPIELLDLVNLESICYDTKFNNDPIIIKINQKFGINN